MNTHKSLNALKVGLLALAFLGCSLLTAGKQDKEVYISLSQKDARVVEKALEFMLSRAPRPDAPDQSSPGYPQVDDLPSAISCDIDIDDLRDALHSVKSKLRNIYKKIKKIDDHIGDLDEQCSLVNELDVNDTEYNVIQWLKTIYCLLAGQQNP